MWHDPEKVLPQENLDWPVPGGVLYENLKTVAGAFERHISITLESFYDARMLLDWFKPDQVEPRPVGTDGKTEGCTALLLPDPPWNDSGNFWVFIGERLQMSARVQQNEWFGHLWNEGRSWFGLEDPGLLGCWFQPEQWRKKRVKEKMSLSSAEVRKNHYLSKELS